MEAERVAIDGGGREKPMAGSRVRKGLRWRQPRSQRHGRFRAWACSKRRAIGSLARLVEHKSRLPAGRWPVALIYHRSFLRCYGLTVYSVLASYIQSPRWLCAARTRIYIYIYNGIAVIGLRSMDRFTCAILGWRLRRVQISHYRANR